MTDEPSDREIEMAEVRYLFDLAERNDDAIGFAARLNQGAFEASGLDARTFYLVRVAAAVALGAGDTTWRLLKEMGDALEIDPRDVLGTLVALAPTVGVPRFLSAADALLDD